MFFISLRLKTSKFSTFFKFEATKGLEFGLVECYSECFGENPLTFKYLQSKKP